jgi:hypothetical protein
MRIAWAFVTLTLFSSAVWSQSSKINLVPGTHALRSTQEVKAPEAPAQHSIHLTPANPPNLFFEAPTYSAGTNPAGIAAGDFNGDGKMDLVVTNQSISTGYSVSILLGNGDGTFRSPVNYAVGTAPVAVAVSDFNKDGKLDLAVANAFSNTVSILLGNGDGTFQTHVDYATGVQPESVAVADLNADGNLDLVATNASGTQGNSVSVLLGNGDGTFQGHVDYATGPAPTSVAVADINGDGKLDLVTANRYGNTVSILIGKGDGTFRPHFEVLAGPGPSSVAVADFNHDGILDLAVASCGSCFNQGTVSILLGNGDGSFGSPMLHIVGIYPYMISVADLNGDGNADVVVTNDTGDSVSVLLGDGRGGLSEQVQYGTGIYPSAVAVADYNGDGKLDLAVADSGINIPPGGVSVLLGSGNGAFHARGENATSAETIAVAAGDLTGRGKLDIVAVNYATSYGYPGGNTLSVLLGNGDGTFNAHVDYPTGELPYAVALGDFNRDGKLDVVVVNNCGSSQYCASIGTISIFLGNGDGTFQSRVDYDVGWGPVSVAVGDFNGDGKLDLAVVNSCGSVSGCSSKHDTVSILLGNGDGTFKTLVEYTVGAYPYAVAVADFNGDGRLDLVVVNSNDNTVSILLGNGDGTFRAQHTFATGSGPVAVAVGNFGNGKVDLAVANYYDNTVSVLMGNGDGTFRQRTDYSGFSQPKALAVGELNGDGKADLIVVNSSAYQGGSSVSALLGNGHGGFGQRTDYAVGEFPTSVVVGDFNGDGMPDLAVANFDSDSVSVLLNAYTK